MTEGWTHQHVFLRLRHYHRHRQHRRHGFSSRLLRELVERRSLDSSPFRREQLGYRRSGRRNGLTTTALTFPSAMVKDVNMLGEHKYLVTRCWKGRSCRKSERSLGQENWRGSNRRTSLGDGLGGRGMVNVIHPPRCHLHQQRRRPNDRL